MAKDELHNGMPDLLSIDNMANGAVYEMLGEALKRLAANISDPNTEATQKREVKITLSAKPYNDRSGAEYEVKVENKLAGLRPIRSTLFIARVNGEYLVFGRNTKQEEIQFGMQPGAAATTVKPS